jgi:glycosyltransferase involved in cell wall biosynthesis
MSSPPLISVIIPTVGRPSLQRAVASALDQKIPGVDVEVIVVNDSGSPLEVAGNVLTDPRVTVVTTNRRRQSVARNVGAAVARGQYLLCLDDDDRLAQGGMAALCQIVRAQPQYVVVYGGVVFVDESEAVLGELNLGVAGNCASPMLAGALISLGSALIRADAFFAVGGIDPLFTISEEIDLFRRLSLEGNFGNSLAAVLHAVRGEGWSSTQSYGPAVDLLRVSRERVLDHKRVLIRLAGSASSPYWRGRNVKAYLASAFWNIKSRRLMKAVSRLIGAALSSLSAGTAVFNTDFWQALRDSQVPATAQRTLKDQR